MDKKRSKYFLPKLTQEEKQGLKDYWEVYEAYREEIYAETLKVTADHPEFGPVLQNTPPEQLLDQQETNYRSLRHAILKNNWEPYIKNLQEQGSRYAQMRIDFNVWYEIVGSFRAILMPRLVREYEKDAKRLGRAIQGMITLSDIAMSTIAESYLDAKEGIISKQKQALEQSEARLRTIIFSEPECVKTLSPEGTILMMNPAGLDILEVNTPDDIVGKSIYPFIAEEHKKRFQSLTKKVFQGKQGQIEYMIYGRKGTKRWMETHMLPLRTNGEVEALGISRDITKQKKAEQSLTESEQLFRGAFEKASIGMCMTTQDGHFMRVNQALCQMLGYSRDEMLGLTIVEITHPDDIDMSDDILKRTGKNENVPVQFEKRYIRKDGQVIWALINTVFVKAVQDKPPYFITHIQDISYKKRADEALRESEQRYRELFESNPIPMWIYDVKTLEFLAVNDAAVEHYGYSHSEFLSMTIKDISPSEELARLSENLEKKTALRQKTGPWKHHKKDGTLIAVEIDLQELTFNGRLARMVLANDITGNLLAKKALEDREKRFRSMIENGLDNISLLGADGTLLWESPATVRTLGYEPDEFIGQNIFALVHPDDLERVRELFAQLIKEPGSREHSTFRLKHKNGSWRWTEGVASNLLHDPVVEAIIVNYRDITERKEIEESIRIKDELLQMTGEIAKVGGWEFDVTSLEGTWTEEVARIHDVDYEQNVDVEFGLGFYLPASREKIEQAIKDAIELAKPYDLELEMISAAGQRKWVRTKGFPINENGKVVKLRGIIQDISEQRQTEIALWETEEKLWAVVNSTPITVFATDAEGIFTLNEGKGLDRIGMKPGDNVGELAYKLFGSLPVKVSPDETLEGSDVLQRVSRGETIVGLTELNGVIFENQFSPFLDKNDQIIGMVGVAIDVTERKQAEEQIEFQASLLNQVRNAVIATDLDGCIIYWNKHAENLYQWKREEVIGKMIMDVNVPKINREKAEDILKTLTQTGHWEGDFNVSRKDGTIFPAHVVDTLVKDKNGKVIGIVGVSIDISERLQMEREEREQRMLAEALRETTTALNSTLEIDDLLDQVLQNIERVVPLETVDITLIEENMVKIVRAKGFEQRNIPSDKIKEISFQVNELKNLQEMIATHQPVIIPDAQKDTNWVKWPYFDWVRSYLGSPIVIDNQVVGFIGLASDQPGFYTQTHAKKLQLFSNQVAIALRNARLLADTKRSLSRISALHEIDVAISNSYNLKVTLDILLRHFKQQLDVDAVDILLYNPNLNVLEFGAGLGFSTTVQIQDIQLQVGDELAGRVVRDRQMI